uniref:SusC/RagA family TonB-linked outer membrane protein n=1 Tax=uncultured Draconibacterium sp. TaxID=1573823 RepID=UPI003217474A
MGGTVKVILFFLLLGLSLNLKAQNPKFNLKIEEATLIQVINLIQEQSSYRILYKDSDLNKNRKVKIEVDDATIEEVLDILLDDSELGYKRFDSQIVIVPKRILPEQGKVPNSDLIINKKILVRGTVSDEEGEPLPNATVIVEGTTVGTTTNINGEYSLKVPSDKTTLVFSYIGMKTKKRSVAEEQQLNVILESETLNVDDIIVTALGISSNEKSLTYAVQRIDGAELSRNKEINFVNSLSGKVSGLNVNRSSSGAGGSTKIVIRGDKSLSGNSEPLFVIDGIPMVNQKGAQPGMFGGIDQGDGLSQVNANDIESITILKGMNASILYGSQGANGVILLTTKKGTTNGKMDIDFSTSYAVEKVSVFPDLQYRYGSLNGAKESWSYIRGDYDDSFVDDFFQDGSQFINSISLKGGKDNTSVYFSYANTRATGIIIDNNYQKNNLTFRQNTQLLDDKLKIGSSIYLAFEKWNNRNPAGYYLNPLTGLYFFPRDRDFDYYKDNYQVFSTERNLYKQNWFVEDHFQSNPYWIIKKEPRTDTSRRLIGSVTAEYNLMKGLILQARGSYDYTDKLFEQKHWATSNLTNAHENGRWEYEKYNDRLIYLDALLSYNKDIGNFNLNTFLGASYQKAVYGDGIFVNTDLRGLIYPNEFYFDNLIPSRKEIQSTLHSRIVKQAVFGNVQLAYHERVFVDFSGRNDWASSLAGTGNESYFYPGIGIAGIFSKIFELPSWICFAKLRSSFSVAVNEVPFNSVNPRHTVTSGGIVRNTTKPFTNLKPERLKSIEVGADIRLLKGRISYDVSYYKITSTDQFITLLSPSGSGYTEYFLNAGEIVNQGFEFYLKLIPVQTSRWNWKTSINYSANNNKVISLHDELREPISTGNAEGFDSKIVPGGSIGDIYVYKFKRDDLGRIILDEKSGGPLKTEKTEYMGNLFPDWIIGWNNTIDYRNLSLSFMISGKFGGKVVSQTEAMLDGMGVSERTAVARDNGYVSIKGIKGGELVSEIDPHLYYSSIGNRNGIKEPYVYSHTNVRLSQLSLTYTLNARKYNLPVKNASITLLGQNLFFLYLKAPFDPELVMNTGREFQSLDNFNLPSSRSIGLSINLQF